MAETICGSYRPAVIMRVRAVVGGSYATCESGGAEDAKTINQEGARSLREGPRFGIWWICGYQNRIVRPVSDSILRAIVGADLRQPHWIAIIDTTAVFRRTCGVRTRTALEASWAPQTLIPRSHQGVSPGAEFPRKHAA